MSQHNGKNNTKEPFKVQDSQRAQWRRFFATIPHHKKQEVFNSLMNQIDLPEIGDIGREITLEVLCELETILEKG